MAGLFGSDDRSGDDGGHVGVVRRYARVAVERGMDSAPEGLTYASAWEDLAVGERVDVPLGRGNRKTGGIVVAVGGEELLEGRAARGIKGIASRAGARLPEPLVRLALWMGEYYVCPLGMVLATMMPSAVKRRVGRHIERLVDLAGVSVAADDARGGDVPPPSLAEPRDTSPARGGGAESAEGTGSAGALEVKPRLPAATLAAWEGIQRLEPGVLPAEPRALAIRLGLASVGPINRLVARGLLRRVEREGVRSRSESPPLEFLAGGGERPTLTEPQAGAVEGISASLGSFGVHLLFGVTGSGKTEVYLRAIEHALSAGRSALVLVPEIALTPQTAGRFLDRFGRAGVGVAVLHSGLAAGERHRQWSLASSGQARVVVGARSAVFAPVSNLGLIVVDEEHDASFKQDQLPRYHARDVAIKRAQVEGCPVVLGSATPSLESWANAAGWPRGEGGGRVIGQKPGWRLWRLPQRVGGGRLPEVRIVDMADERRKAVLEGTGRPGAMIGPTLSAELSRTLAEGGQAILLLNRRGYATHLSCASPACGWTLMCHACDAALVLHQQRSLPKGGVVRCHHCLGEELVPTRCPVCGRGLARLGTGTQRVEEELAGLGLDEGALLRVDSDSMDTARDYFDALSRFARGEVRVLLGTQMVAKGLDFPNVRLVGVLSADTSLHLPDFRAGERTFQLICQVAGRAGRGEHAGLVVVQTMSPREPAIVLAGRHDFEAFAGSELLARMTSGLPPATRMARVIARDADHQRASEHADRIAEAMKEVVEAGNPAGTTGGGAGSAGVTIMGPMDCLVGRIAGHYRVGVEVIAPSAGVLHRLLGTLREKRLLKSDAQTAVDVDPVSLM